MLYFGLTSHLSNNIMLLFGLGLICYAYGLPTTLYTRLASETAYATQCANGIATSVLRGLYPIITTLSIRVSYTEQVSLDIVYWHQVYQD
jgi:hypothetical protein